MKFYGRLIIRRRQAPLSVSGFVVAVSASASHQVGKNQHKSIKLLAGLGVEGDAHCGETVQHRSRVRQDPNQPNLRQIHLLPAELFDELRQIGITLSTGEIGENITTSGVDLLALPVSSRLHMGDTAIIEITGLRNPCVQLNEIHANLMAATLGRDEQGNLVRKAGVMGIVVVGGEVKPGDSIAVEFPAAPH